MTTVETALGPVVLSHDANCWSDMLSEDAKRRTRPLWHYNHISDDILPALRKAGISEEQIEQMLVRNPRAIFEAQKPENAWVTTDEYFADYIQGG